MQSSSLPKISIITPSFNQAAYLEKTITSVLNQNYPNLEYIIIDGGSSDGSVEIIRKYSDKLAYWVSEKDKGQSDALNKGFARSTGEIIYWINSDDYLAENVLTKIGAVFHQEKVDMLLGVVTLINTKNEVLDKENTSLFSKLNLFQYWKRYFVPCQPGIFFRRNLLKRNYLVVEKLYYGMDHELWLHLLCNNKQVKVGRIQENIAFYLFHEHSKSQNSDSFKAFLPEWKNNIATYLPSLGIADRIKIRCAYYSHLFKPYWHGIKRRICNLMN